MQFTGGLGAAVGIPLALVGGSGAAVALEYRRAQKIHEAEAQSFKRSQEGHKRDKVFKESSQNRLKEEIIKLREEIGLLVCLLHFLLYYQLTLFEFDLMLVFTIICHF